MPYEPDDDHFREYHVTPRYLAGSGGTGDAGFEPVAHWPHHYPDDGPCQLLVTSPDHRIRIGWFGDDYDLWKITAAEDAVSTPRWVATFNQNMPPEIVAGFTRALADDWSEGNDDFLRPTSPHWSESVRSPATSDWTLSTPDRSTVELTAPDELAGLALDRSFSAPSEEPWVLWAGPPGWGTRAEATFTARTPTHLIAASAAALADPAPVVRTRGMINRRIEHLVRLAPVAPETASAPRAPTPLDVRRTAVSAALRRASRGQGSACANAARIRTTTAQTGYAAPEQTAAVLPPSPRPSTGRGR
ncbi:DUF317 domain-containing protein [Streptomyces calidiresistens]